MANIELTQQLVKELFDYRDGFLYWRVYLGNNKIKPGQKAGGPRQCKDEIRWKIKINSKTLFASRIIFLWHYGYMPFVVDHENRNCLDDRIENLRDASLSQNAQNTTSRKKSSSVYLGVCKTYSDREKKNIRWVANIKLSIKQMRIGSFKTENEAALAYNREAVRHHKEFANLNIVRLGDI